MRWDTQYQRRIRVIGVWIVWRGEINKKKRKEGLKFGWEKVVGWIRERKRNIKVVK